jgi:hypothetical protein
VAVSPNCQELEFRGEFGKVFPGKLVEMFWSSVAQSPLHIAIMNGYQCFRIAAVVSASEILVFLM